jgi:DNA-binding response OmpR family regulator
VDSSRGSGTGGSGLPAARLARLREQSDPLRLVVCEPDARWLDALANDFASLNVDVTYSCDGARTLLDIGTRQPDVVMLAARLPVVATEVIVRTVRQAGNTGQAGNTRQAASPQIVIGAAAGDVDDGRRALEAGADRLVFRPYRRSQVRQILLDLRSIVELESAPLRAGRLSVAPLAYEVRLDGKVISMAVKELEVLVYLMSHADRIGTVAEMQDALWGADGLAPRSNTVAVTVQHLRARFGPEGAEIIRTIRRRGYRFYPPELPSS